MFPWNSLAIDPQTKSMFDTSPKAFPIRVYYNFNETRHRTSCAVHTIKKWINIWWFFFGILFRELNRLCTHEYNFQELKISLRLRMINEDVSALEPYSFNDNFLTVWKMPTQNSLLEQKLSIIKRRIKDEEVNIAKIECWV